MDPAPVGALEKTFRRATVADPRRVAPGIEFLAVAVGHHAGTERPLEKRRLDPLATTRHLPRPECGADRRHRRVGRAEAEKARGRKERTVPIRALLGLGGHFVVGLEGRLARKVRRRTAGTPPLLPLEPDARRHERVEGGAIGVTILSPVARDRALDQPGVRLRKRCVVDAQFGGLPGFKTLHHHVGLPGQRLEDPAVRFACEIEFGAAPPPEPAAIAELAAKRVTAGALDLGDTRPVVRKKHGRNRTGDPLGKVQHANSVEHSRHRNLSSPRICSTRRRTCERRWTR